MADMRSKLNEIYSLEQLSNKNTVIHKIHPMIKIIVTIVYIVCLLMKNRYDLFGLAVFLFYPIIVMALAEIPYKMIFKRTLVTLPFVFFAGMVTSYYLYSNFVAGFFPKSYAMIWGLFTLLSPVLAFFCWYAKGKGWIAFIISAGILGFIINSTLSYGM